MCSCKIFTCCLYTDNSFNSQVLFLRRYLYFWLINELTQPVGSLPSFYFWHQLRVCLWIDTRNASRSNWGPENSKCNTKYFEQHIQYIGFMFSSTSTLKTWQPSECQRSSFQNKQTCLYEKISLLWKNYYIFNVKFLMLPEHTNSYLILLKLAQFCLKAAEYFFQLPPALTC